MPSVPTDASSSTNSGIITDSETGQRHIPSSVRADGSKRKEIKIRPGYRPPEDVEIYKNRTAHAFKTRGSGGIPGAEGLKDDDGTKTDGAKLNKNAKRREARKKAKAADGDEADDKEAKELDVETKEESALSKEEQETIENEKKAKKLKKKLREARELQEKKEKGEKLLHEQFEKVIKINELIRDLDKLGFDSNGEPKPQAGHEKGVE